MRLPKQNDRVAWMHQDEYGTLYVRTGSCAHIPHFIVTDGRRVYYTQVIPTDGVVILPVAMDMVIAVETPKWSPGVFE